MVREAASQRRTNLSRLTGLGAVVLAVAAVLWPASPFPDREIQVWGTRTWAWDDPDGATEADRSAAMLALVNDDPLPPGFSLHDDRGRSRGVLLAGVSASGKRLLKIVCSDDSSDLGSLEVSVEGALTILATRDNGLIVDADGDATAEITVEVSTRPPLEVALSWFDPTGVEYRSDSHSRR